MTTPRLNDPCPCGSQQKYKLCCGRVHAKPIVESRVDQPRSPHDVNTLLLRINSLLNHSDEADHSTRLLSLIDALKQAYAFLPNRHDLGLLLANTYIDSKNYPDAIELLKTLAVCSPYQLECANELAVAHLGLFQWEPALSHARHALALDPRSLEAHGNVAQALAAIGDFASALQHYDHILARAPGHPAALLGAAQCAARCEQFNVSVDYFRKLEKIRPLSESELSELIWALWCVGEFKDTVNRGSAYLATHPNNAAVAHNVGNAYLMLSEPIDALRFFELGLSNDPNNPLLWVSKGLALKALGQLEEAAPCADRALAISADNAAALCLRGSILCDHGQFSQALAIFERVLEVAPQTPDALVGLSRCKKMTTEDVRWHSTISDAISRSRNAAQQANLLHALGKFYDDCRDYEQSFLTHQRANELIYKFGYGYKQAEFDEVVSKITHRFTTHSIEQLTHTANQPHAPIFILGMPRSGTTLMEQMISGHQDVHACGELVYWNFAQDLFFKQTETSDRAFVNTMAEDYLKLVASKTEKLIFTDKLPANFFNLGLIASAFPNAKIIHMDRHPLDTALSIYFQGFSTAHRYAHRLHDIAHYYSCYQRLIGHWQSVLPAERFLTVSYESLVSDPEGQSKAIFDYLGLKWSQSVLNSQSGERPVLTASGWQVRQPIHTGSIRRSRAYNQWLEPIAALIGRAN